MYVENEEDSQNVLIITLKLQKMMDHLPHLALILNNNKLASYRIWTDLSESEFNAESI